MELDAKFHGALALTSGDVTYRYKTDRQEGICKVAEVRATCVAVVKLPRWYDIDRTPAKVQAWWKELYERAKQHEFGHADICLQVAKDVERAVWKIKPQRYCDSVEGEIVRAASAVIDTMDARQREFDRVTDFGRR